MTDSTTQQLFQNLDAEPKIYILYENPDWLPPINKALEEAELPFENVFVYSCHFDLLQAPPLGVYINRTSPSSHTRGHNISVDMSRELLVWLESHNRRVINGERAFQLEMSKVRQYEALRRYGIKTPHTIAVSGGVEQLKIAVGGITPPFITKHNRGGKGLGVKLFKTKEAFLDYLQSDQFEESIDHVTLLQEYIESPDQFITRVELLNGKYLYAINSDTSRGFELCPSDACDVDGNCPATFNRQALFSLREDGLDKSDLVKKLHAFMKGEKLDIAGIEFIEDADGVKYTYDVNGTTNYSPAVEQKHGLSGWTEFAQFLKKELSAVKQ